MRRAARVGGLSPQAAVVLCLLPVAAALVSLCIGRMGLPLGEVLRGIGAALGLDVTLGDQTEQILWTIRMPRILLALLVGALVLVSLTTGSSALTAGDLLEALLGRALAWL